MGWKEWARWEWSATRHDSDAPHIRESTERSDSELLTTRGSPALPPVGRRWQGWPLAVFLTSPPWSGKANRRAASCALHRTGSQPTPYLPALHHPRRIARACGNTSPSIYAYSPRCHGLPPGTADRNSALAPSVVTQAAVPPNGIKFAARWEIRGRSGATIPAATQHTDPEPAARPPRATHRGQREAENPLRYRLLIAWARS
jgi:hypothetical protein